MMMKDVIVTSDAKDEEVKDDLFEDVYSESSNEDPTTSRGSGRSGKSEVPLGHEETKAVSRSKKIVYLSLILTAAAFGVATYVLLDREEEKSFEDNFENYATELLELSEEQAERKFSVVKSFAISAASYAEGTGMTWPNVTIGHFEPRVHEAAHLSDADLIGFIPIVQGQHSETWPAYAQENCDWIQSEDTCVVHQIHNDDSQQQEPPFHVPLWQSGPSSSLKTDSVTKDLMVYDWFKQLAQDVIEVRHVLLSGVVDLTFLAENKDSGLTNPRSMILEPIYGTFDDGAEIVGFVFAVVEWKGYFEGVLPNNTGALVVDLAGTCGSEFTYVVNGHEAIVLGEGDLHDPSFDHLAMTSQFASFAPYDGKDKDAKDDHCVYTITVYPSNDFYGHYTSNEPILYAACVVMVFCITIFVFFCYDWMVERRQNKVLATAQHSTAIVSSLFPKAVTKRLMEDAERDARESKSSGNRSVGSNRSFTSPKNQLKTFLGDEENNESSQSQSEFGSGFNGVYGTKPIAELFPSVTVMFADIVGFTAWSSMREPSQVFTLLETIYHEFDVVAKQRRVFKVETVGDCYVAVVGLPEPRKDHATVMARYASDCLHRVLKLTKDLEIMLGPDTAELGMRFGMHSGPVTAGVLRGDKARFQLFGDTVNTTARVETSGAKNKIHVSKETADLLIEAGKGHWLVQRPDKIHAKGKGEMTTFWLTVNSRSNSDVSDSAKGSATGSASGNSSNDEQETAGPITKAQKPLSEKHRRLVDWNTELMKGILKKIESKRINSAASETKAGDLHKLEKETLAKKEGTVMDEVTNIISLPHYNEDTFWMDNDFDVELGCGVALQLQNYIENIARMYRDNPFHNYDHATHVTMSVSKLMARIVTPEIDDHDDPSKLLHDHSYGITSDPLTQFTIVLSALIHDVDHPGVPNSQLVKEGADMAKAYNGRSVAEQNSLDIAWKLLMSDGYKDLRHAIYSTEEDFKRFRQMLVNFVLATDIMDKDLGSQRKERWTKAFAEESQDDPMLQFNRRATVVLEYLLQASDVAHTMQHWNIYRKWNMRLFCEMYEAYKAGRSDRNPADFWYEGEIGFFDNYILPLASKLRSCGVFGVASDEYLAYAQQNRVQWERSGREVVAEMVEQLK